MRIKKEKNVCTSKLPDPAPNPIAKSNAQAWIAEKQKLIAKIANLQSENQHTVLKLKEKEAECSAKLLDYQHLQQNFSDQKSALSNESSLLRSELLAAKNELSASKSTISNLKSENRKLCAVIKQLKSAKSNADHNNDAIDDFYEVEKLLAHKNQKDAIYYLVRWQNYTAADDTWQKESDLRCPEILMEYKRTKMNNK